MDIVEEEAVSGTYTFTTAQTQYTITPNTRAPRGHRGGGGFGGHGGGGMHGGHGGGMMGPGMGWGGGGMRGGGMRGGGGRRSHWGGRGWGWGYRGAYGVSSLTLITIVRVQSGP